MKKIVKLTESDLTRIVRRTLNEMEDESDSLMGDAKSVVDSFMMSISDRNPRKQLEAIEKMINQLKSYKVNLEYMGGGNPNTY